MNIVPEITLETDYTIVVKEKKKDVLNVKYLLKQIKIYIIFNDQLTQMEEERENLKLCQTNYE